MKDQNTTAPAPNGTEAAILNTNYTTEALKGLERSMREHHTTKFYPEPCDDAAVEAGLAYKGERGIQPTTLGILVFDEYAKANGYIFRHTTHYQKRLVSALREAVGLTPEGPGAGIGISETGECACPMCGAPAPASILNGETLTWWVYQINNLRMPRLGADVERGFDLEMKVTRQ